MFAVSFRQLVEVNAHSLFSKWFSESGKLVNKLFGTILELVEDPDVRHPFFCIHRSVTDSCVPVFE